MPLSIFLIMHGCSTFTIFWLGTLYHGANRDDVEHVDFLADFSAMIGAECPKNLMIVDIALLN